ncbi:MULTISPECIES: hypothetical protein [Cronobacter]|uniref:hypothetical protein n=1 Tax=Cronobacter TaxID=413496 RepID=UPI00129F93FB|nr:hypothetical protein [Cronobacter sp. JZ38]ELY2738303.1 hypothetical protein [Cronobacter dublinensis]
MSLQRGEASAFMTRMVNDTASYVTLIAAMTYIVILADKRGYPGAGIPMAIIYGLCGMVLLGHWITNVIEESRKFRIAKKGFWAALHVSVIALVTVVSCLGALVVTIVTLTQSV